MNAAPAYEDLARRDVRVLRPQDAAGVYAHPRQEMARLTARGRLCRLARGYYAVVPQRHMGTGTWRPGLEAAAWGVAAADYGRATVALMGVSAARVHGAIPRALGVAVVAVPKQRPALRLVRPDAEVVFVTRDVGRLDVERTRTELGDGWVTSVEQTVLDLAARPALGGVADEAGEAAVGLLARADRTVLEDLARAQRRRASLVRLLRRFDA